MRPIAAGWRMVRVMAACMSWLAVGSCTDCFFKVQGRVVDCGTNAPLSGAAITVHVDQGIHGPRALPGTFNSDAAGLFEVNTDGTESCAAWVTLTFQKDGYASVQTQLKGTPEMTVQQCLTRAATVSRQGTAWPQREPL